MAFRFEPLGASGLILVEPTAFEDRRGFFMEVYKRSEFAGNGIVDVFVQDNCSRSVRGTLRGLHYQRHPKAQAKLVGVVRGEIFDVAVDLRRGSPEYGRCQSVVLSDRNRRMLYVPAGFAHGFCVLSEVADVVYKASAEYDPALDGGILWNDPEIGIRWPIERPLLSEKDARLPRLRDSDPGFRYG
ncbi:MAG TPA: dTDP-4-dehydrorhamnose 3,5-epimerase [candidate division Zixibacteria bacterium]|nr:dTDP-4-dehydrorhamnose 3,5-epimerase [candidate division Zixibacteria bacterium]